MTAKENALRLLRTRTLSDTEIGDIVGRSKRSVRRWRREAEEQQTYTAERTMEESEGELKVQFTSVTPITTKEEAAQKAGVDLTQWRIVSVKTKAYQSAMKVMIEGRERPVVQQLWGITVIFAPKLGPDTTEQIEAIVDGVLKARHHKPLMIAPAKVTGDKGLMQQIVIADPHLSKLCWPASTGDEAYDLSIAEKLVYGGVKHLVAQEPTVTNRVIAFLGDYFHYDTLTGTTTAGTGQDRDSRLPKMMEVGAELATKAILYASLKGTVRVVLVAGNHDAVLSVALQRILVAEFKGNPDVTIDDTHTLRKYHTFGKNLFMYNHGDKRKKELASTMAIEQPKLWGASVYREIHTGHLHNEQEQFHGRLTHHGALVITHPSMSPPDQWHSDEQYVGASRGMLSSTYDINGGVVASHFASPRRLLGRQG